MLAAILKSDNRRMILNFMKAFLGTGVMVSLCACSSMTQDHTVTGIYRHTYYTVSRNDLNPTFVTTAKSSELVDFSQGGIGYSQTEKPIHTVVCNAERTSCKHGIIKTTISFDTTVVGKDRLLIKGVLHSEVAPSQSLDLSGAGLNLVITASIRSEVAALDNLSFDQPINREVDIEEPIIVPGIYGAKAVIKYSRTAFVDAY